MLAGRGMRRALKQRLYPRRASMSARSQRTLPDWAGIREKLTRRDQADATRVSIGSTTTAVFRRLPAGHDRRAFYDNHHQTTTFGSRPKPLSDGGEHRPHIIERCPATAFANLHVFSAAPMRAEGGAGGLCISC
jgi:hypothetical protein